MRDKMLGADLLSQCLDATRAADETNIALKHIAIGLVHRAMTDTYGVDYSVRCMECAMGFNRLLKHWGLDGPVVIGALCIPHITANTSHIGWAGFWGKDHHFWAMSNKHEVIDLALSQNHLHPVTRGDTSLQPPAVWISVVKPRSRIISHLPYKLLGGAISETEQERMDQFLGHLDHLLMEFKESHIGPDDIRFNAAPFVTCFEDLGLLASMGNEWSIRAAGYQDFPQPSWIAARIAELEKGSIESTLEQPGGRLIRRSLDGPGNAHP